MNGSSQAVSRASGCHADHSVGTDSFPQQGLLLWISVPMATVWPTWKDFPEADLKKKNPTDYRGRTYSKPECYRCSRLTMDNGQNDSSHDEPPTAENG